MSGLLEQTIEMAKRSRRPVADICAEAGVQPRWYYLLVAGKIKDPSVRKVQALHDVLEHLPDGGGPSGDCGDGGQLPTKQAAA